MTKFSTIYFIYQKLNKIKHYLYDFKDLIYIIFFSSYIIALYILIKRIYIYKSILNLIKIEKQNKIMY